LTAVVIRAATRQDLDLLEGIENDGDALLIERFRPEQWWPAATGRERAAAPGFILVFEDEVGSVVGFVHVIECDGLAHLEQLSVLRSAGRRGFGRALVQAAKAEGARRGHRVMTLRTYADVPWNAPFYETVGFHPSEPVTPFHRSLLRAETGLGLNRYGRRLQMTAVLRADQ
jgi:GNAT superfamily N-acetyltransferase